MLARCFMSAADLEITEDQLAALIKVLDAMERGEFVHVPHPRVDSEFKSTFSGAFNMGHWDSHTSCGTVCCIGGAAEQLSPGVYFKRLWIGGDDNLKRNEELDELFNPLCRIERYESITLDEAKQALRNYLTTGTAKWREILGYD